MAKKKTDERNGENVDGEEPNFEDPEGFVDDISDQGASSNLCIHSLLVYLRSNRTAIRPLHLSLINWFENCDNIEQIQYECNYSKEYVCQHGVICICESVCIQL